ncbi:hypothetical protein CVT26_002405 [Gymnopilus dilepis]|uniref:DUF6535 domain-containing protein n=1 Tax=Gymnopilus dilepis TaxID=231916 RepID=A0A409Y3I0_9AGAR|nr:hypothetical protein CVT26_002405 [Gymnopilus dilepis]
MSKEPQSQNSSSGKIPKKWQCGDPYQYPVTGTGDPWEKLLAPRLEKDNAQCDAWRDEVQNLLIFAGLFSGVLTAFVILSYQGLQPDPNQTVVNLLGRITNQLEKASNSSSPLIDIASSGGSPAASAIRINIFWFISLVLSLTTALISIISLQWLREHQRYPSVVSSKEKFAILNMRTDGLEAWYVPEIFSALPLLLQIALALFFVGLADFLLATSTIVAIPVIIFIGIPLAFIFVTTTIPALQPFVFCVPILHGTGKVPSQAPYKSTQSLLLLHFLTFWTPAFKAYVHLANVLHSLLVIYPLRLLHACSLGLDVEKNRTPVRDEDFWDAWFQILCTARSRSWTEFDQLLLQRRDVYAKTIFRKEWYMTSQTRCTTEAIGPAYDAATGISSAVFDYCTPEIHESAYLATQDLIQALSIADEAPEIAVECHQYLQRVLVSRSLELAGHFPSFSAVLRDHNVAFMRDETTYIFLSQIGILPDNLLQHFAELNVRLMNHLYSCTPLRLHSNVEIPTRWYATGLPLFTMYTFPMNEMATIPKVNRQDATILPSIVEFLADKIEPHADKALGKQSDFVFYAACFCARSILQEPPSYDSMRWGCPNYGKEEISPLLSALRRYLAIRPRPDEALADRLEVPSDLTSSWWDFLKSDEMKTKTEQKVTQSENVSEISEKDVGDLV